jgi:hypothetical protein
MEAEMRGWELFLLIKYFGFIAIGIGGLGWLASNSNRRY